MTLEDAIKPVHFDPEPIFIGPKPGWTGPVLAAKPTSNDAGAGSPDTARAYVNDKPPLAEGAEAQSAPAALKGALKPVKLTPLAARPHKPVAAKRGCGRRSPPRRRSRPPTRRFRPPIEESGRSRRREKCLGFARLWSIRRRIGPSKRYGAAMVRFGAALGVFCPPAPERRSGPRNCHAGWRIGRPPPRRSASFFARRSDAQAP